MGRKGEGKVRPIHGSIYFAIGAFDIEPEAKRLHARECELSFVFFSPGYGGLRSFVLNDFLQGSKKSSMLSRAGCSDVLKTAIN